MSVTSVLDAQKNTTLVGLRRIRYVHQGIAQAPVGPLECAFDDGVAVVLDAGGDGETLTATVGPWVDVFKEPLSEENREFVELSGKWTGFEVVPGEPLWRAVGQPLLRVEEISSPLNKITGVLLRIGSTSIRIYVEFDELFVDVA